MVITIPQEFKHLEINEQWGKALESVYTSRFNTLLIGKAGTGKSQFIHLMKALDEINKIPSLYIAPTGIASVNIGGATIHSTFKMGIEMRDPSEVYVSNDTRELLSIVEKIVIDEASMLRADIFDIMNTMCQQAKSDNNLFGNIQVIVVSDLYQLPPVIGRTKEEKDFFYNMYGDNPYFFGSDSYIEHEDTFNKIEFEHIYRQDDLNFKEILNRIRVGEQTDSDLDIINSKRIPFRKYRKEFPDGIYISPYNDTVSKINNDALKELPSRELVFKSYVNGYVNPKSFLVSLEIKIKENAKVMMLVNDMQGRFQNGTQGRFLKMVNSDTMLIEIGDRQMNVVRHEFAEYKYVRRGGKLVQEKKGSFNQFPLKLCYAVTAHKSQSATFHEGYVDFGHSLAFTDHLAYVMLSRFSDLERIGLQKRLSHGDVCVSLLVRDFMGGFIEDYIPAPREGAKEEYKDKSLDAWNTVSEDDLPF